MNCKTIYQLLQSQARQTPKAAAITAPNRDPLTYTRLVEHVQTVVSHLNGLGIGRNQSVALVLPNGPEMVTAFLSVASGATAAPLNPAYRPQEFDFYLSDLQAQAVIVPAGQDSPVRAVAQAKNIPIIELVTTPDEPAGVFSLATEQPPAASNNEAIFARPDDVALVLHTSGTTARPKIVPTSQTNLLAGVHLTQNSLELTPTDRYLCIMPLFHMHGLVTSLAALMAGGTVFAAPNFEVDKFFGWMQACQPTWYSGAPTLHQAVLELAPHHTAVIEQCPLRLIRSSAAALPPQLLTHLETTFNAPVIEGYGMTESALYITSNLLHHRKIGSVGVANGTQVAIMDSAGALLPVGQPGQVVVRGANIITGYQNNSAANQSAFVDGWFCTGDQGYLDEDGYLYLTGRLKEIINRGGEKISPQEVEHIFRDYPEVAQAVTFAVPHPTLGEDVATAVILHPNSSATTLDIRKFALDRLAAHKVPSQVIIVTKIPTGPTGKLQRIGLSQKFSRQLQTEFVPPRNLLETRLVEIWADVLGLEQIGVNDNFFALGGNSLMAMRAVNQIRQRFQINMALPQIFEAPTVAALAHILQSETWQFEAAPDEPTSIPRPERPITCPDSPAPNRHAANGSTKQQQMEFSLFFFSADGSATNDDKYQLFLESVKFADQHGLSAVWIPERHFHPFGGLYPNPSVLGAAIATITQQIQIRAGSVVIPFQDPLRVAEEWSVIDNLSGGRVGIACASGWHTNDFVLAPQNYENRKQIMADRIETIQKLWRGDSITRPNGSGNPTDIKIYPRPVQPTLPMWLASHSDATFIKAAEIGANILTVLWDTSIEELARKIELYRKALAQHGRNPTKYKVTLMLHTFIGPTMEIVRQKVKTAYKEYLYINLGLQQNQAQGVDRAIDLTQDDKTFIIAQATEQLFRTRGLVGTPEICLEKTKALQAIGVNEIACLIDFGIEYESTMQSLQQLSRLNTQYNAELVAV